MQEPQKKWPEVFRRANCDALRVTRPDALIWGEAFFERFGGEATLMKKGEMPRLGSAKEKMPVDFESNIRISSLRYSSR
jgi:hypothetical protein